jgi:hypothetical protein
LSSRGWVFIVYQTRLAKPGCTRLAAKLAYRSRPFGSQWASPRIASPVTYTPTSLGAPYLLPTRHTAGADDAIPASPLRLRFWIVFLDVHGADVVRLFQSLRCLERLLQQLRVVVHERL